MEPPGAAGNIQAASARAILIDDNARLVLIKRTRPGRAPYWTTAGGGVEDSDPSAESAMRREIFEELGAEAGGASQVFMVSEQAPGGTRVQHFFVARLVRLDLAARNGPELLDPSRGAYDVDYVDLRADALGAIDLRPAELKDFILANRAALLAEAGLVPQIRAGRANVRHDAGQGQRAGCRPARTKGVTLSRYRVVEICAGAGGQSLGLELAGFGHDLSVELDQNAAATLRHNRPHWKVAVGDVAHPGVWDPASYAGVDLLAGGVPCPPFTIAGKQLGATDERDLFAWAIELCGTIQPRALLLENVRGLSLPRFAAYRQHVLDRLASLGYAADWRLLHASDYGVPQLRPRFVLVAMKPADFAYFTWPSPRPGDTLTVGETLLGLMAANGWPGAAAWAAKANDIAPTIVGGSKKHGGADLGPTRAKRAWRALGVDALGVADAPPSADDPVTLLPKLTCEMVARIQGWNGPEYRWEFTGGKTSNYRQIGNAFPPPVARALGDQVRRALDHEGTARSLVEQSATTHDPVYAVLRDDGGFLTMDQILRRLSVPLEVPAFERHLAHLKRDFHIEVQPRRPGDAYKLGPFKAFTGQDDHLRHEAFLNPTRIS